MKQKVLSLFSLIGGILVVLIGIAHTAATPVIYRGAISVLHDKALGMAYFFGVMGLYVILSGWLMVYSSRGLRRLDRWAWSVSLFNGLCNVVCGVGAMIVGFRHSLVWIWFVSALSVVILCLVFYKTYRQNESVRIETSEAGLLAQQG